MTGPEILLDPVDFVTVGTLGPKGQRVFYLQAGKGNDIVTLVIEKQQAQALSDAIEEILENLDERFPGIPTLDEPVSGLDMALREPLNELFRVAQMGLGYDETRDLIVLVAQELVVDEGQSLEPQPQTVRMWGTRGQMKALSDHAKVVVKKGRSNPKSNGFMTYYWT